jgi:acylphosphatase
MRGGARADAMTAWQVIVRGRVQGVGYRYAMAEAATALGLAGWVRNRRDGTVEALVQGDADALERLVAWCRRGPPAARVTAVSTSVRERDPAIDAFECRGTE